MAALADVGWEVRLTHLQGAIIVGSVVEMVVGYTGLIGKLLRFVGPITIAPTIALIGLALFEHGAPKAGTHWGIGGLTIALVILFSQYLVRRHRVFQLFPVLLAIVGAWAIAWSAVQSLTGHPCQMPAKHQPPFGSSRNARPKPSNVVRICWLVRNARPRFMLSCTSTCVSAALRA